MAQHTRAPGSSDDYVDAHNAATMTTAPERTDPGTDGQTVDYAKPGRLGINRAQAIFGVIFLIFLAGIFTYMWASNRPQPAPAPQPTPVASTTAPGTPTVAPSTTAYAAAEQTYRAWQTNYAAAVLNYQPQKLDATLVTPDTLAQARAQITRLGQGANDTGHYTQDIKSITGANYSSNSLTLRVCAVHNFRFIDPNGKDVTVQRDGTPAPVNTTARAHDIKLSSADSGQTWQVAQLVTEIGNDDSGSPC